MNAETNAVQENYSCKTLKNGVTFGGSGDVARGSSPEATVAAPWPELCVHRFPVWTFITLYIYVSFFRVLRFIIKR